MSNNVINLNTHQLSAPGARHLEYMLKQAWLAGFLSSSKRRKAWVPSEAEIRRHAAHYKLPLNEARLNSIFN